jgi:hypothetical protein
MSGNVRQSTLRQVFENTESTQRQYALRQHAVALGLCLPEVTRPCFPEMTQPLCLTARQFLREMGPSQKTSTAHRVPTIRS